MKCPIHGDVCEFVSDRYFCQQCGFSWTTAEILKYEKLNNMEVKIMDKLKKEYIRNLTIICVWGFIVIFLLIVFSFLKS